MGQENTVPRRINKVEGAAGQLIGSGGPGVNESWINMLTYVEIAPVSVTKNAGAGWVDWDLSGSVPAGTKYVEIVCTAVVGQAIGARKNGTATARTINNPLSFTMTTEVDGSRVIEVNDPSGVNNSIYYCTGYWI